MAVLTEQAVVSGLTMRQKLSPTIYQQLISVACSLFWKPASPKGWVVSLHGSQGFATDDLALWHTFLANRGLSLVTSQ